MVSRLTIKDHFRESRLFNDRAAIALALMLVATAGIISWLIYLQIISHDHFTTLAEDNRINIVAVPPTRGLIFDRNGVLLAQNLPSFSLEVIPEQIKDLDSTFEELKALVDINDSDIVRFKKRLKVKHLFDSIPIRFRLSEEEVARFAVNRYRFPGVDIESRLNRDYPLGELAVHTIGYVGRINEAEQNYLDERNYRSTNHIGKIGVEKQYESILHGTVGFQRIEANAVGRRLRVIEYTPPIPGDNLYLTIDATLQAVVEEALGDKRGAIVAIDINNGDVLAIASKPAYNPNSFVNGIEVADYKALQGSKDKPLFNRALQGQYPPGSTLKPFIGLAALEQGVISTEDRVFCRGWYVLKDDEHRYRDWKREGHRDTNLHKAIVQSCDVYFYDLALQMGIDRMHSFLESIGLGKKTGIDIPGEQEGLIPSRAWKLRAYQQPWFPGETLITGIGQGFLLTTPVQLASITAGLANKGQHNQPRVVGAIQSGDDQKKIVSTDIISIGKLPMIQPSNWDFLIKSMIDVVHTPKGTAHGISPGKKYKIAGKTGTAQVFGIKQDEEYTKEEVTERLRDHALFIAFAPADKPQIAIAVVIENGGSGGAVAAPIAGKIFDFYLDGNHS